MFSTDGYIINQPLAQNIPYGHMTSNYNGCGWMAAYNLLRACRRPRQPDAVAASLAQGLICGGRLGTGPLRLARWLRAAGLTLSLTLRRRTAEARMHSATAGCALYLEGIYPHYVVFLPQPEGDFRFLNRVSGAQDDRLSLRAFARRHPLALYYTVQ